MPQLRLRSLVITCVCAATALALCASVGSASSVTHSASLELATTNWSTTMTFPRFDSSLGCLDSICFNLNGHVQGTAKFESLDASPATVTMDLAATLTLQRPDGTTLVVTMPLASTSDDASAYDGTTDFAGTSGATYSSLSADKAEAACTSATADFTLFTGTGDIVLPVVATGTSTGSGAGNLILQFATDASAGASVTYYYSTCTVPSRPTTWGAVKTIYR